MYTNILGSSGFGVFVGLLVPFPLISCLFLPVYIWQIFDLHKVIKSIRGK